MSEKYEVITYEESVVFNYTLPGEETPDQLEREMTLVWEEDLEAFVAHFGAEKAYKLHAFDKERDKLRFVSKIEDENDGIIDQVDEEISQRMKFGFLYTSPTYED
jgi:hypothetical protein